MRQAVPPIARIAWPRSTGSGPVSACQTLEQKNSFYHTWKTTSAGTFRTCGSVPSSHQSKWRPVRVWSRGLPLNNTVSFFVMWGDWTWGRSIIKPAIDPVERGRQEHGSPYGHAGVRCLEGWRAALGKLGDLPPFAVDPKLQQSEAR